MNKRMQFNENCHGMPIFKQKCKKNSHFKARRTIFLVLVIVCISLFLPIISGFDFDNVIDYKNNDLTVEITNAFGLGEK